MANLLDLVERLELGCGPVFVVTAIDELYGFADSTRRIRRPHLAVTTGADAFLERVPKNLISGLYFLRGHVGLFIRNQKRNELGSDSDRDKRIYCSARESLALYSAVKLTEELSRFHVTRRVRDTVLIRCDLPLQPPLSSETERQEVELLGM